MQFRAHNELHLQLILGTVDHILGDWLPVCAYESWTQRGKSDYVYIDVGMCE